MFSSKSFIVLALTFRFLSHFKLIFEYVVRKGSSFYLLHVGIQLSQYYLLKDCSFPKNCLGILVKNQLTISKYNDLCLDCQFCPIDLYPISILMPVPHCFDYYSLVVSFFLSFFFQLKYS